ncbi:MAG: lipopolysaccharide export system protein LptA [Acetobacteraceae bacterium]|nr:lipopolysaccharide export system protein LptA [Acetobacteraceae bacterium]
MRLARTTGTLRCLAVPACAILVLTTLALTTPALTTAARAQQLDLTHGGPIDITATDGLEWRQNEQEVIARGDARAIRGGVTVNADRLTAWYRKKGVTQTAQPAPASGLAGDPSTEGNEIYRLQADGHVHIFTATDQAQGDKATYDLDQAVMVMTGRDLKLTTPNDVITAKDDLEYWPQKHMAVARGDAVVTTNDAKRVAADTLVAYTTDNPPPAAATQAPRSTPMAATPVAAKSTDDPLAASGKLQRVEAFGNVSVRTPTDTVTGDRGVYVPDTGMARLAGNVRITRGQNQLNGAEADVNMKTGIATLVSQKAGESSKSGESPKAGRVHGLVVPNDETSKSLSNDPAATAAGTTRTPAKKPTPAPSGQAPPGQTPSGQTPSGQTPSTSAASGPKP